MHITCAATRHMHDALGYVSARCKKGLNGITMFIAKGMRAD